jgi:Cu(I)/Ag(I) efflux system membrane fusion protein
VAVDETRLHHIHTKVSGWIEMLSVTGTGEPIRKGQPLLTIYSPEILATQEEYLLALRARDRAAASNPPNGSPGSDELVESARRRLLLFDLTVPQIEALDRTGIPTRTVTLFSPISGHILKRNVAHGERIDPGVALLDIADLSRVWAIASIYEYELPFVHQGQAATMTLSYLPGRLWRGRLDLVYPTLDAASRTAQVRMTFDNPDLELKPEMFAQVDIESDQGTRLAVPEEAVLSSGARDIVFVETAPGTFEPRAVTIGLRISGSVEITAGLVEGELVVASGNFLIDSESRLESALQAATER